ncbi:MAG: D-cysteine desulfhydrase family protein [Pseudomonadota bacterium]
MNHPRFDILLEPSPLRPAKALSEKLGISLWLKRDDLTEPSFGGNKSRQLEYYFGAAIAENADTILITGAVQSNFVRLAAAIAKSLGMHAVAQLEHRVKTDDVTYKRSGNVLLDALLGAEILEYPEGEDEAGADQALYARAAELRAEGRRPYVIPLSENHPPLGALGYVNAAKEILAAKHDFDVFVVASGSGATHSGLLSGLRGQGCSAKVIGSCVRRPAQLQTSRIKRIVDRLGELYEGAHRVAADDIDLWDGALAPGYGQIGASALDAMKLMAQSEGIFLDPVYTAKSFAGIPALVADGKIPKGASVCFVHTGGLAGLFGYSDILTDMLGSPLSI